MRISDWSSDVCSSDLRVFGRADRDDGKIEIAARQPAIGRHRLDIALRQFDPRTEGLERLQVQVDRAVSDRASAGHRSEEHTSELQSLMRSSHDAYCLTEKDRTTI